MARAWWQGSGASLAAADRHAVLGELAANSPFPDEPRQKEAWRTTIEHLAGLALHMPHAHIFLEFAIPRMGRRADAVIVAGGHVFVLEYKVGATEFARHALAQVHGYALDLRHFHETSHDVPLVPMLVATEAPPQPMGLGFMRDGVAEPLRLGVGDVLPAIRQVLAANPHVPIDPVVWAAGAYRPTPTIVEAAQALYRGHRVEEISRSGAGAENLTRTAAAVDRIAEQARSRGGKALVVVTGVPGAGKTLAGLNLVCTRMNARADEHAAFLTGNGPLAEVLREALTRDRRRHARQPDPGDPEARFRIDREPDAFIQLVHRFRDEAVRSAVPPPEQLLVFDEAQRAWDAEQTARFMARRGHTGWTLSEPAFLLSVADRRLDWAVVVALVGKGQEIHRGEAGIGAWLEAVSDGVVRGWTVHHSPDLGRHGKEVRQRLALLQARGQAEEEDGLQLATSIRSFRAAGVSDFVAALLSDDPLLARARLPAPSAFPVLRTRSLAAARGWLMQQRRANERVGLLAHSQALRLKPEGLHVKVPLSPASWFLDMPPDIRSSDMLEDAATEFQVQGLELDWTGVAWDLSLRRSETGWEPWSFRGAGWNRVHAAAARGYTVNAYRVLLTRARQGLVIFVPRGDKDDPTRPPAEYDAIDHSLAACGIPALPA